MKQVLFNLNVKIGFEEMEWSQAYTCDMRFSAPISTFSKQSAANVWLLKRLPWTSVSATQYFELTGGHLHSPDFNLSWCWEYYSNNANALMKITNKEMKCGSVKEKRAPCSLPVKALESSTHWHKINHNHQNHKQSALHVDITLYHWEICQGNQLLKTH